MMYWSLHTGWISTGPCHWDCRMQADNSKRECVTVHTNSTL